MSFPTAGRSGPLATLALLFGLAAGGTTPVAAQIQEDLAQQATDPTASLLSVNLYGDVRTSFHDRDESGFEWRFQPVVPFSAFGMPNILRVVVPYQASGPGAEGLKSVSIFNLTLVDEEWGRWGVGPVMTLAEGVSENGPQFAIGPAVGAVYEYSPVVQLGIFNQNLIGSDFAITQFQPIIAYQLGNGWSLAAGDLQFVYDWDAGAWTQVPLGFQLGLVKPLFGQPMRFSVNPMWNVRDRAGTFESKIVFGVTLLAPTGG